MKILLRQQPRPQWLCFQCQCVTISRAPPNRGLRTSSRKLVSPPPPRERSSVSSLSALSQRIWEHNRLKATEAGRISVEAIKSPLATIGVLPKPHHLHVRSTRHNTHITLSNGDRQPIISVSSGNIGFRHAARGSYDAGYQLGSYVMGRIMQRGLLRDIHSIELILRDFGAGREAIHKILLGAEGRFVRDKIVRVMDATKLKFGGVRGKRPRRL